MSLLKWFIKRKSRPYQANYQGLRTSIGHSARPALELLEDRTAPAVALTYAGTGTALTLTELVGGSTGVTISDFGSTLTINLNGQTFDASSSPAIPGVLTYFNGNTEANVDISVTGRISTLATNLSGDQLDIGPISNLDEGVSNINAAANANLCHRRVSTTSVATGNGNIALTSDTFVFLNAAGDNLLASDGSITVKANVGNVPTAGDFSGIEHRRRQRQTSGIGNILLEGQGGIDSGWKRLVWRLGPGRGDGVDQQRHAHHCRHRRTGLRYRPRCGDRRAPGFFGVGRHRHFRHRGDGSERRQLRRAGNGHGRGAIHRGCQHQPSPAPARAAMPPAAISAWKSRSSGAVDATNSGSISITGTGGAGAGTGNFGVEVDSGGIVSTDKGNITLKGTGGNGANGVDLETSSPPAAVVQATGGGSIDIVGNGGVAVTVGGGVQVTATGNGTITLDAAEDVVIGDGTTSGTKVATQNGALTISANQGLTPASGDFAGITVNFATVEATGAGPILMQGQGGSDTGTSSHEGVLVENFSTVQSSTGNITLDGTGGVGGSSNIGVEITNATVTSASGIITITGQGANGSADSNAGVEVDSDSTVSSTGSVSPLTATIVITGTGGQGTSGNAGTEIFGAHRVVVLWGHRHHGQRRDWVERPQLRRRGSGHRGAIVGDDGTNRRHHHHRHRRPGHRSQLWRGHWGRCSDTVTSATGDITIIGSGGTGTTSDNFGVSIDSTTQVTTTIGANANITITGTGGTGDGDGSDQGVLINGPTTAVEASGGGSVAINGSAIPGNGNAIELDETTVSASGQGTVTVIAVQNVSIFDTTLSTVNGDLTIKANQGGTPAAGDFSGITIDFATVETTGTGDIIMAGRGGNDSTTGGHFGVGITDFSTVQANGRSIAITGSGGTGTSSNYGVEITDTSVTLADGAIAIAGTGGLGSADHNFGVELFDETTVSSTGTGSAAATITINGTGGTGSDENFGVDIRGGGEGIGPLVTSIAGDITITGTGGDGTTYLNYGVQVIDDSEISSTGAGPGAATITITGTGGTGTDSSFGVNLKFGDEGSGVVVTSVDGTITITGSGGNATTGTDNYGVGLVDGAGVTSTGALPTPAQSPSSAPAAPVPTKLSASCWRSTHRRSRRQVAPLTSSALPALAATMKPLPWVSPVKGDRSATPMAPSLCKATASISTPAPPSARPGPMPSSPWKR